MIHNYQLGVIREAFGRLVWTHKTHEKERERFSSFALTSKWINIVLCALTFGGVAAVLGTDSLALKIVSTVLAVVSAGFAVFQLSFDPAGAAEAHRTAAKRLLELRNQYELLIADVLSESLPADAIRARRDALQELANVVYRTAPNTSRAAFLSASKALGAMKEMTFDDGEIDSYLPAALRGRSEET